MFNLCIISLCKKEIVGPAQSAVFRARSEPQFQNIEIKHLQKTRSLADVLTSLFSIDSNTLFNSQLRKNVPVTRIENMHIWLSHSNYNVKHTRASTWIICGQSKKLTTSVRVESSHALKRSITRRPKADSKRVSRARRVFPTTPIRVVSPNINKTHLIETD